jgi:hypothetical protein
MGRKNVAAGGGAGKDKNGGRTDGERSRFSGAVRLVMKVDIRKRETYEKNKLH